MQTYRECIAPTEGLRSIFALLRGILQRVRSSLGAIYTSVAVAFDRLFSGKLTESLKGGHEITEKLVLIKNEDYLLAYEIRKGTVDSEATIPLVGPRQTAQVQLNDIVDRVFVNKYGIDKDYRPLYDTSEGETAPIQDKDLTPEEDSTGTRDQSRSRSMDANVQNIGLQLSPIQSLRMLNSGYYRKFHRYRPCLLRLRLYRQGRECPQHNRRRYLLSHRKHYQQERRHQAIQRMVHGRTEEASDHAYLK